VRKQPPVGQNADDPAAKNRALSPAARAGRSGDEIHEDKAAAELLKLDRAEKDWLDYFVAFFAFIASLGAIAAALVASYQGWVARDTEKRQLRAYVFLESVKTASIDDDAGADQNRGLSATIIFKNFGQTPAYNVRHSSSLKCADYPPAATVFTRDREKHPITVDTLGPQGGAQNVIQSSEGSMSAIERKQLMKAQTKAIYVFGKIDYEDAFGVRRCTSYRFMVGGDSGLLGGDMLRMDSGNEADTDCEKLD
jgi:hypothetical protein